MGQGQESHYKAEKKQMSRSSVPPPVFMKQLLARIDPHQQAPRNAALQSAQATCGRWVGLRRLQIGLTSDTLAGMAGISTDKLLLIETGLATPDLISSEARQSLGARLVSNQEDKALGPAVVGIALGRVEALNEQVLGRVLEDLEAAEMSPAERDRHLAVDLVEVAAPEPAAEAEPFDRRVFEREPGMYEVLWALINGARHVHAIWLKLKQNEQPVEMVRVGLLINRMRRSQLVSIAGKQPDPDEPGEYILMYRATSEGHQAFAAERRYRLVMQAKGIGITEKLEPEPGGATNIPSVAPQ